MALSRAHTSAEAPGSNTILLSKFYENLFCGFYVILLTNQPTKKQTWLKI